MILHSRTSLYIVIGCRWLSLIIGLLVHSGEFVSGDAGLVLAAVSLQTLYSLFFLNKSLKRLAWLAISMDLLFQIYLLWSTGGLTGPFIFYSLSSLAMLKAYTKWKTYYAVTFLFFLFNPILLSLLEGITINAYLTIHGAYILYVVLFYSMAATVHYCSIRLYAHIRTLVKLYSSSHLHNGISYQAAIEYVEEFLKEILEKRKAWLCISGAGSHQLDQTWTHTYFSNGMEQIADHSSKGYIQLPSPTGEMTSFYMRAMQDRSGNRYGWLLVQANTGELSMLQKAYIQLVLMKFETYYDINIKIKEIKDIAIAMERDSIAQNIHDGIAQELFFYSIQLFQLKNVLQGESKDEALSLLTEMEKKVKESHRDIRKFITELKGEKRRFNLHDAIERMLHRITDHTGVRLDYENVGWIAQERVEIEETIYHFIEEAANNVIKHAKATMIHVKVEVTSVQWNIMIKDDGQGIMNDSEAAQGGKLGINGMTNRIKALNGSISIRSDGTMGTTIMAAIPRERSLAYV